MRMGAGARHVRDSGLSLVNYIRIGYRGGHHLLRAACGTSVRYGMQDFMPLC